MKPIEHHATRREFVQSSLAGTLTAVSYGRVLGANDRVGLGFIGNGLIGRRHLLDFRDQADVNPIAVAETHRGRLEEARTVLGTQVQGHGDFRRLFDDKAIDAVVVSTPDHWHALMTMLACAAGKDVYVEKPLTLFVREGRWMIDVARRNKRIVQVGTQQRSGPHYQKARELIRQGHIGKVCSVRMGAFRNIMPGFGSPPDQDPPPELNWDMLLGPAPYRRYNPNRGIYHFRWFWDYSGGQMTNLGQHSLDIVYWYLGVAGPVSVASSGGRFCLLDNGETPDTQDAFFSFPDWTAIWSHREAARGTSGLGGLEFFGTKGSLAVSRRGFVVTPDRKINPENAIPSFTGPRNRPRPGTEPGTGSTWTQAIRDESGSDLDQFKRHARNFLDCVKSRQTPISDLESGHRVATACHLANISLRLGRSLRWDASKEEILGDPEANRWLTRPYRAPWDAELRALGVG